jgi:hypothetical protein
MKHWWHSWRARVWGERLAVVEALLPILERCDREYGSSYYSDRLIDATKRRAEAAAAHKYHSERARATEPYYT